jgi:hypothetical protein
MLEAVTNAQGGVGDVATQRSHDRLSKAPNHRGGEP